MAYDQQTRLNQVETYLDAKEAILDAYIDAHCEHELFIASYIHGHFSVVAATIMQVISIPQNSHVSAKQWQQQTKQMLSTSVNEAIANNELAKQDAKDVQRMVNHLFADDID